ncbi:hypothetical protein GH714_018504 [Hevea brasiliensis]|uniref:Uncharacterized protein n=1 Tax=Hevea brasiliensis TaxID=3981 RepID=A0A6A6KTF7_HEVBR|nr:hypothetical protein GH714_018504 [Hevea brasiliensis]
MESETLATLANSIKDHLSLQSNGSLSASSPPKQPFIIGVAGGTASGKTTVCNMIISQLHDQGVLLINQDSFYHSLSNEQLERVHEYNFDHPDAFNTELLLSCMEKLKHGQAITLPNYDFKSHQSTGPGQKVNPSDVIILEGILVLHDPRVRDLMNMKIFVDTDSDLRLARRIQRDTVERGRNIQNVLDQVCEVLLFTSLPTNPNGRSLDEQNILKTTEFLEQCKAIFFEIMFQVVEHGLGHLPFTERQIKTPTGSIYPGVAFCKRLCGVSVIRSGESMENALRACCKGIKIGKILIHREGNNGQQLIYEKLPADISSRHVLLLDPVLASGNCAVKAISLLLSKGVPESSMIFLNLIAAPQGIHAVCKKFPKVKIVTSEIDVTLDNDLRVIPGMGEFGDRYFGTDKD